MAAMLEYNAIFKLYLVRVQQEGPGLLSSEDDVHENYGFNRTMCKTTQGRARAAALGSDAQDTMNCWRTNENVQGPRPCFTH